MLFYSSYSFTINKPESELIVRRTTVVGATLCIYPYSYVDFFIKAIRVSVLQNTYGWANIWNYCTFAEIPGFGMEVSFKREKMFNF